MSAEKIGPYRCLEMLGKGGMGVVHKAQHEESGELVALKTIKIADERQFESIRREVRALARIRHPGIVRIVAEGMQNGVPWYAMDFVEGVTLRRHIYRQQKLVTENGRAEAEHSAGSTLDVWWTGSLGGRRATGGAGVPCLPRTERSKPARGDIREQPRSDLSRSDFSQVLQLVHRLCAPLAYLHGEGIVHRDLKPDNVMITSDEKPVLVDFGLVSRFSGEESRETLTVEYGSVGTVNYMAPEQILGEFVDARADLYALGCILFELLVGHPPFIGVKAAGILRAHLSQPPNLPSRFRPDLPPELDDLVGRMLTKDPRERVGHAGVVAATLARIEAWEYELTGPSPKPYLYRSRCAGRDAVFSQLGHYHGELTRGHGGFALISGESGVGKTRLAMEYGRKLTRAGVLVLTGDCSEGAGRSLEALLKPLQSIADRCREKGQAETDRLVGRRGKVLAMFEPSLKHLPGQEAYPEPGELSPDAARIRLFNDLSETFRQLASRKGLVLLLDDLHWCDDLTLAFFQYELSSTHFENTPFVIIGTYRRESISSGLQCIIDTPGVEVITLERLDQSSTTAMVGDMLGMSPAPERFAAWLNLKSEGNPLFVSEYLRVAIDTSLLYRDDEGSWRLNVETDEGAAESDVFERLPLPTSLQGLVCRRLEGLPAEADTTLEAAAILGRETSLLLLQQITGLDHDKFHDTLDLLLKRCLLEKSETGMIRFSHVLNRDLSQERVPAIRMVELHRRVAESIELVCDRVHEELPADLALHWERAGDIDKACFHYLRAARSARKRYDLDEAVRLFRDYLRLSSGTAPEHLTVRVEVGSILEETAQYAAALKEFETVNEHSTEPLLRAVCWRKKAVILGTLGECLEARQAFRESLALSVNSPLEQARTLNDMAYFESTIQDNNLEAEQMCSKARDLILTHFPALGDGPDRPEPGSVHALQWLEACQVLAGTFNRFGVAYHNLGELDRSLACYQKALGLMAEIDDRRSTVTILDNLGVLYLARGDIERALEYNFKALALCEDSGDQRSIAIISGNIGAAYHTQGNFDRALEFTQKFLSVCQEIGDRRSVASATGNMGVIHRDRGEADLALDFTLKYLALSEEVDDKRSVGNALSNLGIMYIDRGESEYAFECLRKSCAVCEEIGDIRGIAMASSNIGSIYLDRDELDLALPYYQKYLDLNQKLGEQVHISQALYSLGIIHFTRGDFRAALDFYQRSLRISEEIKNQWHICEAASLVGSAFHALGDLDQALLFYQKSLAVSEEIDDQQRKLNTLNKIGLVYRDWGECEKALEYQQISLAPVDKLFNMIDQAWRLLDCGETYRLMGKFDLALQLNNQAKELFTKKKKLSAVGDCWCHQAECEIDIENFEAAHISLTEARKFHELGQRWESSWRVPLIKARLAIAEARSLSEAKRGFTSELIVDQTRQLVARAYTNQDVVFRIRTSFLHGLALSINGLADEARASFEQALALARKCKFRLLEQSIIEEMAE